MGNGGVAAIPLEPGERAGGAVGGDELARGLVLVRASAMKIARLHVAIERRDRRLVLETMDDLAALDGRIRDLVEDIPTSDREIGLLQHELEQQRIALTREKLALAAGISRGEKARLPAEPPAAPEAPPAEAPQAPPPAAMPDIPEPAAASEAPWVPGREEAAPRGPGARLFALASLLLLALALAGAAFASGAADWPATLERFLQAMGA